MAGAQGVSWVRRRIEEPVTQHLEAEGLDFLQFTFRRALPGLTLTLKPKGQQHAPNTIGACATAHHGQDDDTLRARGSAYRAPGLLPAYAVLL